MAPPTKSTVEFRGRQLSSCITEEDDGQDEDPWRKFNPHDPQYWIACRCPILKTFILVAILQLLSTLAALALAIAQIAKGPLQHDAYFCYGKLTFSHNKNFTDSVSESQNFRSNESTSISISASKSCSGTFYGFAFEMHPIYLPARILFNLIHIFILLLAVIGLGCLKNTKLITALIFSNVLNVILLFIYVATLAYYSMVTEDYSLFCFVGIAIILLLLLNILL